jgi:hypothetical protein
MGRCWCVAAWEGEKSSRIEAGRASSDEQVLGSAVALPRAQWRNRVHRDGEGGLKGQESGKMRMRGLVDKIPTVMLVVED